MYRINKYFVCLILFICIIKPYSTYSHNFICFSLNRAKDIISKNDSIPDEVRNLGYITRLVGIVYDSKIDNLILVGFRDSKYPEIALDDFIIALRTVFLYPDVKFPGLSIEPDKNNPDSDYQLVRYVGGIQGTRFGLVCLETDLLLKKIGFGLLPTGSDKVISPWTLQMMLTPEREEERYLEQTELTRSFFYPIAFESFVVANSAYLQSDRIIVLFEGKSSKSNFPQKYFAKQFTENFDEVACSYPILEDLRNIMSAYALAKSIPSMNSKPDLDYWHNEYKLSFVQTPVKVQSLKNGLRGLGISYCSIGQVELRVDIKLLEAGDPLSLAKIALLARPSGQPLTWSFDLMEDSLLYAITEEKSLFEEAIDQGKFLYEKNNYYEAISKFNYAEKIGVLPINAVCQKALCLSQIKKTDFALDECNKALKRDSTNSTIWMTQAKILLNADKYKDAKECVLYALKLDPDRIDAELIEAEIQLKLSEYDLSLGLINKLLTGNPNNNQALLLKGQIYRKLKKYEEASKTYENILKNSDNSYFFRTSYFLRNEIISNTNRFYYYNLPSTFSIKKYHLWRLSVNTFPEYIFGQAYAPSELKKFYYIDRWAIPLLLSFDVIFWNRLKINFSTSFDIDIGRFWSQKKGIPDTSLITYDNVHGISGKLGYSNLSLDWMILNGLWSNPFLVISTSVFTYPYSKNIFEIFPFIKTGYSIPIDNISSQEKTIFGNLRIRAEIPVSNRQWFFSSINYLKSIENTGEHNFSLDFGIRSLLTFTKNNIYMNFGSSISDVGPSTARNAIFFNKSKIYRQFEHYISLEQSFRSKFDSILIGILIVDDPITNIQTRYILLSLQLGWQIFSKGSWF